MLELELFEHRPVVGRTYIVVIDRHIVEQSEDYDVCITKFEELKRKYPASRVSVILVMDGQELR